MSIRNISSRNFNWNLIKSFLLVVDAGSLSAASKSSGISQPTLSRHMDELEASLGVVLFVRGRRGALPTDAAIAIMDHAREIHSATRALSLSATGKSEELRGTVRITASQMVASYILPEIIAALMDVSPEVEIELVATDEVESLSEREADIAVRMVRPQQPNLVARKVNEIMLGSYAHKSYINRYGSLEKATELLHHRVIGYDKDHRIISAMNAMGIAVDRSNFRLRSDDQIACWHALCAGIGVGFAPNYLARKNPDLIAVGKEFPIPTLPVWLVTHREIKTSRRIRMVFDFLVEELGRLDLS